MEKSADAYRTISEVAEDLKLPQHVLRFWETRFPQIKPLKRGGGRRFYRPDDVDLLRAIKTLLYGDGYTIRGVQRLLKEQGPRAVAQFAGTKESAAGARRFSAEAELSDGPASQVAWEPSAGSASADSAGPEPGEGNGTDLGGLDAPDIVGRLEAILFELSECERLIAAARA